MVQIRKCDKCGNEIKKDEPYSVLLHFKIDPQVQEEKKQPDGTIELHPNCMPTFTPKARKPIHPALKWLVWLNPTRMIGIAAVVIIFGVIIKFLL